MHRTFSTHLVGLVVALATVVPASPAAESIDAGTDELAKELLSHAPRRADGGLTLAVIPFTHTDGSCSELGTLVVNEMMNSLFGAAASDVRVVERAQLEALLEEIWQGSTGIYDAKTIKALRLKNVDALILGSISSVGDALRFNARMTDTETAEVVSAAATSVPRTGDLALLATRRVACGLEPPQAPLPPVENESPGEAGTVAEPLTIDAREREPGSIPTDLGDGIVVRDVGGKRFFAGRSGPSTLTVARRFQSDIDVVLTIDWNDRSTRTVSLISDGRKVSLVHAGADRSGAHPKVNFAGLERHGRDVGWKYDNEINMLRFSLRGREIRAYLNDVIVNSALVDEGTTFDRLVIEGLDQNDRVYSIEFTPKS